MKISVNQFSLNQTIILQGKKKKTTTKPTTSQQQETNGSIQWNSCSIFCLIFGQRQDRFCCSTTERTITSHAILHSMLQTKCKATQQQNSKHNGISSSYRIAPKFLASMKPLEASPFAPENLRERTHSQGKISLLSIEGPWKDSYPKQSQVPSQGVHSEATSYKNIILPVT